jgi:uncharacterized protein RhaS with RHS repeats
MNRLFFLIAFVLAIGSYAQDRASSANTVHSIIRTFSQDGTVLSEINYVDGKPIGEYKYYYPGGQLQEHGEWNINHQVGTLLRYDSDGTLIQKFEFNKNGHRIGEQFYFYTTGEIRTKKVIDSELNPVKVIHYNPDGRQKSYILL